MNDLKVTIKDILGVPEVKEHDKYLGLPSFVGRSKYRTFNQLKEKVWKRVNGWKEKLLSQAGKEILIKAVAQAMPTYTMNVFLLPKWVCSELKGIIRQFWWGQKGGDKKVNWLAWKKMCVSKFHGGMGFRDLESFNLALLAKQGWRLIHESQSLFAKVFKAKYFPNCSFLQAKVKPGCSYVWRSLAASRHVLEQGSKWRIGNGKSISICQDRWIPDQENGKIPYPIAAVRSDAVVAELIDSDRGGWKEDLVRSCFSPVDVEHILHYPLHSSQPADVLIWWGTSSGKFFG